MEPVLSSDPDCVDSGSEVSDSEDPASPTAKKKCMPKASSAGRFKKSWKLPVGITTSTRGDQYAFCKLCMSHFGVSHGGFNDVSRHIKGSGHQKRYKDAHGTSNLMDVLSRQSSSQNSHARKVIAAEIMMSNFIAMHNLPFLAADHLSSLFSSMFPDSAIAADFGSKRTKTTSIVCEALDPYYKKSVLENLHNSPFSLLCDESNEKGDSVKLLTILVRAYESSRGVIATRHIHTVGITDMTANGIFTSIKDVLDQYGLSFSNIISFASDTCNVMKGIRNGVIAKIRQVQPSIIDIHCICHLVNLCVKAAVKVLPLKVDDILVDIYYHFRSSVKSIATLKEYTEFCAVDYRSILKHCETRWLSLTRSIKRTLDMWEPLVSYFTSHEDVEKPGRVKSIYNNLTEHLTRAWMLFLSNVLVIFDKYNIYFQTTKACTIHKLHAETERLLKTVHSFFVKPSVIRANATNLTSVDCTKPEHQLVDSELFIGDDTTAFLLDLFENEGVPINSFYKGVRSFYVAFVTKLKAKFDFKSSILTTLKLIDPPECLDITSSTFDQIHNKIPIKFDKTAVKLEFRGFAVDSDIPSRDGDATTFWLGVKSMKTPSGDHKYWNLSTLALQLLSIPASNADCERVFSLVRRIKTDFRSSLHTDTISSLIGVHFNTPFNCCEQSVFETPLLDKAKQCTREKNASYTAK